MSWFFRKFGTSNGIEFALTNYVSLRHLQCVAGPWWRVCVGPFLAAGAFSPQIKRPCPCVCSTARQRDEAARLGAAFHLLN